MVRRNFLVGSVTGRYIKLLFARMRSIAGIRPPGVVRWLKGSSRDTNLLAAKPESKMLSFDEISKHSNSSLPVRLRGVLKKLRKPIYRKCHVGASGLGDPQETPIELMEIARRLSFRLRAMSEVLEI